MTGGSESFAIASRSQTTAVAQNSDQSPLIAKRFARMRLVSLSLALSLVRPFSYALSLSLYLKLSVQTLSDYKVLLPEAFLIQRSLYPRFLYSVLLILY